VCVCERERERGIERKGVGSNAFRPFLRLRDMIPVRLLLLRRPPQTDGAAPLCGSPYQVCPGCGKECLHPFSTEQRDAHAAECGRERREQQRAVESETVECGICLEVVMQKERLSERRFGVLPACSHAFCLVQTHLPRPSTYSDGKVANRNVRRALTRPFRDARRFPSPGL
jgi:hypothetical protein